MGIYVKHNGGNMNNQNRIYFVLIFIFLLFFKAISINLIYRIKRRNSEKIVLNKKVSIMGLVNFLLFITWVVLITIDVLKAYKILNKGYLDSIFQMFDLVYMDNIMDRFLENGDLGRHLHISSYVVNFTSGLLWGVFFLCNSIFNFYNGAVGNIIYKEGILISDHFYIWKKFKGYYWSGPYNKSFKDGAYYKLLFKFPKFYYKGNEMVLNVDEKDKGEVDKAIADFVTLTEQQ